LPFIVNFRVCRAGGQYKALYGRFQPVATSRHPARTNRSADRAMVLYVIIRGLDFLRMHHRRRRDGDRFAGIDGATQ
jgi:hypothetical protein